MERRCDRCKATMALGRPRVRVGGKQLWCQTCAKRHGASGQYEPGTDIAKVASVIICRGCGDEVHYRAKDLAPGNERVACPRCRTVINPYTNQRGVADLIPRQHTASLEHEMNIKIALREQKTGQRIIVVAHDSGDGQTIYHCPFCGSGQVIARSDRTIECEFCHTSFTVQVQPEYSAFPQTMDGQPVQVPGMPGQIGVDPSGAAQGAQPDPADGGQPGAPDASADSDGDGTPDDQDFDPANPASASNQPPWLTTGLKTSTGARLPVDEYVRHLAIKHADQTNRPAVLRRVRASRES